MLFFDGTKQITLTSILMRYKGRTDGRDIHSHFGIAALFVSGGRTRGETANPAHFRRRDVSFLHSHRERGCAAARIIPGTDQSRGERLPARRLRFSRSSGTAA